ncbi:hypothetical protein GCM10023238_12270 [Streptomyces heliomycini]
MVLVGLGAAQYRGHTAFDDALQPAGPEGSYDQAGAGGAVVPQPAQQGGHVVVDVVDDDQGHPGRARVVGVDQVDLGAGP